MLTTQKQVRAAFRASLKPYERRLIRGLSQNACPVDVRCQFVDFVDYLARDGQISEALAAKVTL
jgi:hypothetical protein